MRLIDADKLWLTTEYSDGNVHSYYEQFEVDKAPTIDAETVVRCKNCKYRVNPNCERFGIKRYTQADSFCSWGERKETEDETN